MACTHKHCYFKHVDVALHDKYMPTPIASEHLVLYYTVILFYYIILMFLTGSQINININNKLQTSFFVLYEVTSFGPNHAILNP